MSDAQTICVVNPQSGGGRTAHTWPALSRRLSAAGVAHDAVFTTARGEGETLTRAALRAGASRVVAVGGDGSIHEVVNGFFEDGTLVSPTATLGMLPAGTGSDLIKTLGYPKGVDGAIEVLVGGHTRAVDLGFARFVGHGGAPATRYFINTASAGLSGAVLDQMERLPAMLKGSLRYNLASMLTFGSYRASRPALTVDGRPAPADPVLMIVVANARFFGGGMQVAPRAEMDDGLFEVLVIAERGLPELLLSFPRIYAGTHLALSMVTSDRGRAVSIGGDTPLLLEIDGEQPGTSPASFEMLPAALRVAVPVEKEL